MKIDFTLTKDTINQLNISALILNNDANAIWISDELKTVIGSCISAIKLLCNQNHLSFLNQIPAEDFPIHLNNVNIKGSFGETSATKAIISHFTTKNFEPAFLLLFKMVPQSPNYEPKIRLYAKVFEASGEAIMITDAEDRIVAVNHAFSELTGYFYNDIVGQRPDFLKSGEQEEGFFEKVWDTVHKTGYWKGEIWHRKKCGEVIPEWLSISAVRDDSGQIINYISIFSDFTEEKARQAHILHQAQHDYLTGLTNRTLLFDRFEQAIKMTRRGIYNRIAVLFIDLDCFKPINDNFGHSIGDKLLRKIAKHLRKLTREIDTVSRIGGDEFLILQPLFKEAEPIGAIAEMIVNSFNQAFSIQDQDYQISVSIGVSMYPDHGESIEDLIAKADSAMYKAKKGGKNTWRIFDNEE